MKGDVMGGADLAVYAEFGLAIFLLVFLAVAVRVFWPGQEDTYEELGRIPLSDDPVSPRAHANGSETMEGTR